MDAKSNEIVDHIDGNCYDNRKQNLRVCNRYENAQNRKLQHNNRSGHRGVIWNKKHDKWMAYISFKRKDITLGYFSNYQKACDCREKAESYYFGEFKSNR